MAVRDWDIFRDISRLRGDLDRLTDPLILRPDAGEREDLWAPAVDIHERDDCLVLLVDLPGLSREDVEVHVDAATLTLEGERPRSEGVSSIRLERPAGRFRRSFRIGVPIDPQGVRASYRDGVLEISIPRVTPSSPSRVHVDVD